MQKLKIGKLKVNRSVYRKYKAFYGHSGRPGKRGGSAAATGSARAVSKVKIATAVGKLGARAALSGAMQGAQQGIRTGAAIGSVAGSILGVGRLTGAMIGAAGGFQYGAIAGSAKAAVDLAVALNNTSKLGALYARTRNAALKEQAKGLASSVIGKAVGFATSYAISKAIADATDYVTGKMFEAKTGRKWSDFKAYAKQQKQRARQNARSGFRQEYEAGPTWGSAARPDNVQRGGVRRLPVKTGVPTSKHRIIEGEFTVKEVPDELTKWPEELVKMVLDYEALKDRTSELDEAFYSDLLGLIDVIEAGD